MFAVNRKFMIYQSVQNVSPDPTTSCGPYSPLMSRDSRSTGRKEEESIDHDTIGMIAIDLHGNMAAGTSTNGLSYKIPGYR